MPDKIFKKEIKYYKFYIALPILLWVEVFVFVVLNADSSSMRGL